MVTTPSVPTRTQPFGWYCAPCATARRIPLTPPNATTTAAVPLETRNARREMFVNAMPSNPGFMVGSSGFFRGTLDRRDDTVIGAATADVALHVLDDLLARRIPVLRKQRRRGHDLARLAVAALRHLLGDPGLL